MKKKQFMIANTYHAMTEIIKVTSTGGRITGNINHTGGTQFK